MVIKFSQRELEVILVTEEQLLCSLFLVKYTCPFSTGSHTLYCDPEVLGYFFFSHMPMQEHGFLRVGFSLPLAF